MKRITYTVYVDWQSAGLGKLTAMKKSELKKWVQPDPGAYPPASMR